ncbi:hypothetical protein PF004_g5258 [Phytophthora fragariae]|uniref:Uncharacterized protein n=1 Tax=Phytophthora fragariae TaxID=53985 RepID=A0A6A3LM86_9STRA|nr:hypothetical protein PF011_g5316 [Phytophthora fragariae]KAE9245370.1 hypothetical protein PF004_g5258 [Phytophthora fragariae]
MAYLRRQVPRGGGLLRRHISDLCSADQLPHRILPLRATNGEEYNQRQNRLIAIGREKQKKWRLAQERERERRRLRQRMSLDDRADGDSSCEEDILTQL